MRTPPQIPDSFVFKESQIHGPFMGFDRSRAPIASGWIRCLAFALDWFVLSVVCALLVSPWSRIFMEAKLLQDNHQMILAALKIFVVITMVSYFYGWFTMAAMSATPGMKAFGLVVINSFSGEKLDRKGALRRNNMFWASLFFSGIGYLSIFSDPLRRGWHDRFAESIVIKPQSVASPPHKMEAVFVYALFYGFYGLAILGGVSEGIRLSHSEKFLRSARAVLNQGAQSDEKASDAPEKSAGVDECRPLLSTLPPLRDAGKAVEQRLEDFAQGLLPAECMNAIADQRLLTDKQSAAAYFAKFVASDDEKTRLDYKRKVCEIDKTSRACELVHVMDLRNQNKWDQLRISVRALLQKEDDYVPYWLMAFLLEDFRFKEALERLKRMKLPSSQFNQAHVLASYIGMGREQEARTAFETWIAVTDDGQTHIPSFILCAMDSMGDCRPDSLGCKELMKITAPHAELAFREAFTLGRAALCQKDPEKAARYFARGGVELKDLSEAELFVASGELNRAQTLYHKLISEPATSKNVLAVSLLRSAWLAASASQQYKAALDFLKQVDAHYWPMTWMTIARQLEHEAQSRKMLSEAEEIARYIVSVNSEDQWAQEQVAGLQRRRTEAAAAQAAALATPAPRPISSHRKTAPAGARRPAQSKGFLKLPEKKRR